MAWKPKEKKLSAEEAIDLAKKELAPYWFGSAPLLAGIHSAGKVSAHPLDPKFVDKTWVILFIDATTFAGEAALGFFQEWFHRYGSHDLNFLLFLRFPYQNVYTRTAIEEVLIQAQGLTFPVAIDVDGSLGAAFGAIQTPKVVCLKGGRLLFEYSGPTCAHDGEVTLQKLLRTVDPGLPLLPVMFSDPQIIQDRRIDVGSIEFGTNSKTIIESATEVPDAVPAGRLVYTGEWKREAELMLTSDPKATISFRSPAQRISVIARSKQKTIETGIIQVQINGLSAYEAFRGRQLSSDDEGNTVLKISSGWLYEALFLKPIAISLCGFPRQTVLRFQFTG